MPSNETSADTQSKPPLRTWQFGLRELLLVVVACSVFCAVASWSIFSALFLLIWSAVVLQVWWYARRGERRISWGIAALLVVFPFFFLSFLLQASKGSPTHSHPASLEFVLMDSSSGRPISGALVELWPNGSSNRTSLATSDSSGKARLTTNLRASAHRGGWGRTSTTLYFGGTKLQVSALSYQSQVLAWEDISQESYRSAEEPPGQPVVIELMRTANKPSPKSSVPHQR